ncbi:hypothetical protein BDN70DRAFT_992325 [Pholiota conissans]|uniref:Uncharacterized protein n=1 Tax=Pholiota conissans TaxID=109636 RepID=A0A9P6CUU3_9AGAR|nr:hypothetical protein BDN70DRAFT_992325 [Pholiota conissans]
MMRFQFLFIACIPTLVLSLPASLVANSDLAADGQSAQSLNAQFRTLTTSSPCGNLTQACVDNSIATCKNDKWDASNACLQTQSCFAVPDFKNGGATLTCTSQKNALSLIAASGATGGITGTDSNASNSSGSTNSKAATMTRGSASKERVTVTVTRTLTKPTDFSATRTIAPQEASSIISSLLADGHATIISQDSEAESTPCPSMKHKKMKTVTTSIAAPTSTPAGDNLATATGSVPSTTAPAVDASSGGNYDGY